MCPNGSNIITTNRTFAELLWKAKRVVESMHVCNYDFLRQIPYSVNRVNLQNQKLVTAQTNYGWCLNYDEKKNGWRRNDKEETISSWMTTVIEYFSMHAKIWIPDMQLSNNRTYHKYMQLISMYLSLFCHHRIIESICSPFISKLLKPIFPY